jgi:hypothetical protein
MILLVAYESLDATRGTNHLSSLLLAFMQCKRCRDRILGIPKLVSGAGAGEMDSLWAGSTASPVVTDCHGAGADAKSCGCKCDA